MTNNLSALSASRDEFVECSDGMYDCGDGRYDSVLPDLKNNKSIGNLLKLEKCGTVGIYGIDSSDVRDVSNTWKPYSNDMTLPVYDWQTHMFGDVTFQSFENKPMEFFRKNNVVPILKSKRSVQAGGWFAEHLKSSIPMVGVPGCWDAGMVGVLSDNSHPLQCWKYDEWRPKWKKDGTAEPCATYPLSESNMAVEVRSAGRCAVNCLVKEYTDKSMKAKGSLTGEFHKEIKFASSVDGVGVPNVAAEGWLYANTKQGYCWGREVHEDGDFSHHKYQKDYEKMVWWWQNWVYCSKRKLTSPSMFLLTKQGTGMGFSEDSRKTTLYSNGPVRLENIETLHPKPSLEDGSTWVCTTSSSRTSYEWMMSLVEVKGIPSPFAKINKKSKCYSRDHNSILRAMDKFPKIKKRSVYRWLRKGPRGLPINRLDPHETIHWKGWVDCTFAMPTVDLNHMRDYNKDVQVQHVQDADAQFADFCHPDFVKTTNKIEWEDEYACYSSHTTATTLDDKVRKPLWPHGQVEGRDKEGNVWGVHLIYTTADRPNHMVVEVVLSTYYDRTLDFTTKFNSAIVH